MIIPEWLIQEPTENKPRKTHKPKSLKQKGRVKIKLTDEN